MVEVRAVRRGRSWFAAAAIATLCAAGTPAVAGPPPAPAATAWVNGTVLDDAGKPFCGAEVKVVRDKPAGTWSAVTDAKGFFAVHGVPAGEAVVVVSARGRVTVRKTVTVPATGTVSTEAKLVPGVRFAGKVVDPEGKPIGGVRFFAFEGAREEKGGLRFRTRVVFAGAAGGGASKDDGTFEVDGLAAGSEYRLRAEHPHYVLLDMPGLDAQAGGGHDALDVVLEPAAWVSGVVVDPAGNPVAGARVLRPGDPTEEEDWFARMFRMVVQRDTRDASVTDPRGRYVLGSLNAGPVRVTATADGYFEGNVTTEALVVGKETSGIKIVLEAATAWLEGEVLDDAGKPIEGVEISATSEEGAGASGTSDAAGKWRLVRVRSRGAVELAATLKGHIAAHKKSVPLNSRGLKLVLARAAHLKIKVVDAKGTAIPDVAVRLVTHAEDGAPDSSWHFVRQTAAGGEVDLPPVDVEVHVSADGFDEVEVGTFKGEPTKTVDGGTVTLKRSND